MLKKWLLYKKSEKDIKAFAVRGLLEEYGFTVPVSKVRVIESYTCSGRPKYVEFAVNGYVYIYDGHTAEQVSKGRRKGEH